jgi:foldase protein PrsA
MAKKVTKEPQAPTRKQIAIRKKDLEQRRRLIIGISAVAAVIILVLIFGIVQVYVLQPQSPIAKVNGVSVSTDLYQKMYRFQNYQLDKSLSQLQQQQAQYAGDDSKKFMYDYYQQSISQLQGQMMSLSQDALNELVNDELIRQEATRRGITVSPEEIQTELEKQFGYDRNPPTPTATPTLTATQVITITPTPTLAPMTENDFKQAYGQSLSQFQKGAGFSEADFRELFRNNLYRKKLQEKLEAEVPTTAEQIHPRHILITAKTPEIKEGTPTPTAQEQADAQKKANDEAKARAEAALKRVTAGGEDIATVAKEVSDDTSTKDKGGDLDWHPRGDLVAAFESVAFSLKPGQIYTDVVSSGYGYHIIKLDEFDPNRTLSDYALQARKSQALQEWLNKQTASAKIERFWSTDKVPTGVANPLSRMTLPASQ